MRCADRIEADLRVLLHQFPLGARDPGFRRIPSETPSFPIAFVQGCTSRKIPELRVRPAHCSPTSAEQVWRLNVEAMTNVVDV